MEFCRTPRYVLFHKTISNADYLFSSINIGVAHVASEDDVYAGYYIPKGSILMSNIWFVSRDFE